MVASNGIPSGGSGAGLPLTTNHALLVGTGAKSLAYLAPSTARNVAISDGTDWTSRALQAADIPALSYVTSVALALPAIFTVSGSPVTGAGTLTGTLATQTANQVWAGPTTGVAAAPTFRSLVAADIPTLTLAKISDAGTMAAQNANAVAITGGTIAIPAYVANGTGGTGYLELANQSSAPSTPTAASRLFIDASNRLSWKGTNGFARTFDGTANTADRIYVLPDAAGTVALTSDITTQLATAIILAPDSSSRNVIQPSGNFIPLVLKGNSAQSVDFLQFQKSNGTIFGKFEYLSGGSSARLLLPSTGDALARFAVLDTSFSNFYFYFDGAGILNWGDGTHPNGDVSISRNSGSGLLLKKTGNNSDLTTPTLDVQGLVSQTAELQRWRNNTPTTVASISNIGVLTIAPLDAATATVTDVAIFDHGTSATPLAGFGPGLKLRGHSAANTIRAMVGLQATYNSPTDASYTTYGLLTAYYMSAGTPTARNAIGWGATGSAALIGFLAVAAAPVALQTTYTQTYTTTASTVNPTSTSAFTGQDNLQVGSVYAKVADLNTLRTDMLMAMQLLNQLIDNDQAYGLAG